MKMQILKTASVVLVYVAVKVGVCDACETWPISSGYCKHNHRSTVRVGVDPLTRVAAADVTALSVAVVPQYTVMARHQSTAHTAPVAVTHISTRRLQHGY